MQDCVGQRGADRDLGMRLPGRDQRMSIVERAHCPILLTVEREKHAAAFVWCWRDSFAFTTRTTNQTIPLPFSSHVCGKLHALARRFNSEMASGLFPLTPNPGQPWTTRILKLPPPTPSGSYGQLLHGDRVQQGR